MGFLLSNGRRDGRAAIFPPLERIGVRQRLIAAIDPAEPDGDSIAPPLRFLDREKPARPGPFKTQFDRFVETAKKIGIDEDSEALDRAFEKVVPPRRSSANNQT